MSVSSVSMSVCFGVRAFRVFGETCYDLMDLKSLDDLDSGCEVHFGFELDLIQVEGSL